MSPRPPKASPRSPKAPPRPPKASPKLPKSSQGIAKASTKALPLRLGFSKVSTKALPQAFRHLIVLSGCSILLLSILKVVHFWCVFELALSWQVFQNDLFKRFSQVVLVGRSLLQLHAFSCIARRRSSKYMVKYIQQKQQRQQHENLLWQFIELAIHSVAKSTWQFISLLFMSWL